jgi:hypothetical protein
MVITPWLSQGFINDVVTGYLFFGGLPAERWEIGKISWCHGLSHEHTVEASLFMAIRGSINGS